MAVAVDCGAAVEAGGGLGSGVLGAQEATKVISSKETRMRARFVMGRFSHIVGIRTRGSLILQDFHISECRAIVILCLQFELRQRELLQSFFVHRHAQARAGGHIDGAVGVQGETLMRDVT